MKITKFQIIVLAIFIVFIIAGVAAFATFKGSNTSNKLPPITIWGTFSKKSFDTYLTKMNNTLPEQLRITYVEKSSNSFISEFVGALARGNGPDVILIKADMLLPNRDKLAPIPYSVLSQRTFLNTFVDASRVYLSSDGITAIPFSIDPMIMYWNRDIYNSAGVATPPKSWSELKSLVPKLTIKGDNGVVTRSAVAMGDFANVDYARELLGTLMLQLGNPITQQYGDGSVGSAITTSATVNPTPALQYFTQFVDPSSVSYSWNRSWPNSKTAFLSGKLANYFGLASDLFKLRERNPNLNFDASPMPQQSTGGVVATYADLYGFSIVRASPKVNAAYAILSTLTLPQYIVNISSDTYLPSVSRSVISKGSGDPYIDIFNRAALISKTWLDSDPTESSRIFGDMIQAMTSGKKTTFEALNDAGSSYNVSLRQAYGR